MKYPVTITQDGDGFMASFLDIPEALTGAPTWEETLVEAADALTAAMDFYFEDRRPIPAPSPAEVGQPVVELPPSVEAKVLLLNELLRQNISNSELARRMDVRPQEVQRIVDLHHATKIDTIAVALAALGRHLELRLTYRP